MMVLVQQFNEVYDTASYGVSFITGVWGSKLHTAPTKEMSVRVKKSIVPVGLFEWLGKHNKHNDMQIKPCMLK